MCIRDRNPTLAPAIEKSDYEPKTPEADASVDADTVNDATAFLETFFKLYPTCLLYTSGSLGGGKSFCNNLLVYYAVLFGGQAVILDPKAERATGKKRSQKSPMKSIS